MKVFISHSSRDKWAARRISQDLNNLGVETFLDEKDIETGAPIDDTISAHLKDCDDCLMLLSPTALNSHWVLVEIGGAMALGKRLVPILIHVGANEIPSPISKHLARDINEIEVYYGEVRRRLSGEKVPARKPRAQKKPVTRQKPSKTFQVGDEVKIVSAAQPSVYRRLSEINWTPTMTKHAGKRAVVTEVDTDKSVRLDIDAGKNWWAFEWLTKQ